MFEWKYFNDDSLNGMEAFVTDDFSIHVIKYAQGEGYHWFARAWDESGQCTVTGSYDFDEMADGFAFMSDAYKSAVDYMESIGIMSSAQAEDQKKPSRVRQFLNKAVQLGFATLVSANILTGMSAPALAYADESEPACNDVFVEYQDGLVGIYTAPDEPRSGNAYFLDENGGYELLEPGSDIYNTVMLEVMTDLKNANIPMNMKIGHIEGKEGAQVVHADAGRIISIPDKYLKFSNDILMQVYDDYIGDDGYVREVTGGIYYEDRVVSQELRKYAFPEEVAAEEAAEAAEAAEVQTEEEVQAFALSSEEILAVLLVISIAGVVFSSILMMRW